MQDRSVLFGLQARRLPAPPFPALSAILQANDGHDKKYFSIIHIAVLIIGVSIATWFYTNGVIGKVWLEQFETLP